MGFHNGAYATVWEVKDGTGNFTDVRISISRKDKQTDEYVQDFSGYARFCKDAHPKAKTLAIRDRIKLDSVDVTTKYDKDKKITYTNYVVYGYDKVDSSGAVAASHAPKTTSEGFMDIPDNLDEELPFA